MGVLICLYDWSEKAGLCEAQSKCQTVLQRLGRSVERYAYGTVNSRQTRSRKTPLSTLPGDLGYFGAYNFDGGEVNLPCPSAAAACIADLMGTTAYLFDDNMNFEHGSVVELSTWFAGIWPGSIGYALPYERILMPETFAIGVGNGCPSPSTGDTSAWRVDRRDTPLSERVRLRDLFEINILNMRTLDRSFSGETLEAWIHQSSVRGTLTHHAPDIVLWTIDQEHLADVRDQARTYGITYPQDPHPVPLALISEAFIGIRERRES